MAIEIFFSYAHEDEKYRTRLEKHLRSLKLQGIIRDWHDRKISAGKQWAHEVNTYLNTAHIILLLVSPDFMASDYCYSFEMTRAMERHVDGDARVIPVILRPVEWEDTLFGKLQALPTDAKPVTRWRSLDEAFFDVARGIRNAAKELQVSPSSSSLGKIKEQRKAGTALQNLKHFEEILVAQEQAIQLDPNYALAYNRKGGMLINLDRYEEALSTYKQAIQLDPNYARAYYNMSYVLERLGRLTEARQAYEKARQLGYRD